MPAARASTFGGMRRSSCVSCQLAALARLLARSHGATRRSSPVCARAASPAPNVPRLHESSAQATRAAHGLAAGVRRRQSADRPPDPLPPPPRRSSGSSTACRSAPLIERTLTADSIRPLERPGQCAPRPSARRRLRWDNWRRPMEKPQRRSVFGARVPSAVIRSHVPSPARLASPPRACRCPREDGPVAPTGGVPIPTPARALHCARRSPCASRPRDHARSMRPTSARPRCDLTRAPLLPRTETRSGPADLPLQVEHAHPLLGHSLVVPLRDRRCQVVAGSPALHDGTISQGWGGACGRHLGGWWVTTVARWDLYTVAWIGPVN